MKPASDQLYFLIKSLTKSEKKYFHQYAKRHVKGDGNNYLKLFEAMQLQQEYDEEALKQLFANEKFVTYFPVAKRYLYQQITDSLHQFHLAHSVEALVRKDLHIVEILLKKNLNKQAQKLLRQIKSQITQYELFPILPNCLVLERQAWDQAFYKGAPKEATLNWKQEMENALSSITKETAFSFFNSMIRHWHYQKITISQKREQEELATLVAQFQLEDQQGQHTLRSKMEYFRAMSTYHFMKAQPMEAYAYNQKLIHLFEQNNDLLKLYPQNYLSVLNNFLIDNHQLKKYEVLDSGIQKLRALPRHKAFKRIPALPQKVFELSTLLELNALIDQQQFEQALQRLPEVEKELYTLQSKISKHYQLTFYYLIALIYFENQHFGACQDWLNRLLQDKAKNMLEELLRFANLLYLLTHYELGHYELLNHLILSVRRKHSQKEQLFQTEVQLFRLLRQLINVATPKEKQALFSDFKVALVQLQMDEQERRVFNYFNWLRWVNGKLKP